MSRFFLCLLLLVSSTNLFAQDPTVPSAALLERLQGQAVSQAITSAPSTSSIVVKAIVMRDVDHGIATLESKGKLYRVTLNRRPLEDTADGHSTTQRQLQIDGVGYFVEEFYDRTIVLSNGVNRFIVQ